MKPKEYKAKLKLEVKKLKDRGVSTRSLGERYGVGHATIWRWCKEVERAERKERA